MSTASTAQPESTIALFGPPYDNFTAIDTNWSAASRPPRGLALVWWLIDGNRQETEFKWLYNRPSGIPVFIILPPAGELSRAKPLLQYVNAIDPRSVLPNSRLITPLYLRRLLKAPPMNLAQAVTQYLARRGLLPLNNIRHDILKIFESVPETNSISKLARRLYTSRRTLGRRFAAAGLPVPSHWLQFARLLNGILRLQNESAAVFRVAMRAGYPDGFTMSNQMKRLLGCRPTDIRHHLGWEWIVETWIRQEAITGGIDCLRYGATVRIYLDQPVAQHQATRSLQDWTDGTKATIEPC